MGQSNRSGRLGITLLAAAALVLAGTPPAPAAGGPTAFYVAIAPYISQTHPCTYHVKGSCQGELQGATFRYWLRSADGAVNRSGTIRAGDDGFVEMLVPLNNVYTVTFAHAGRRGTGSFTSKANDPTCITTIQLK